MPKISIITTTYNHKNFIRYAIESVLSQTFSDWEMLIGDDNSPDGTYDIALQYAQKDLRIKVWKHQENQGIVENMNFLLSQVSDESEYIAFLEGDDMYTPDNLLKKLEIFQRYPDIGLVYCDYKKINKDNMDLVSSKNIFSKIKHHSPIKHGKHKISLLSLLKIGNPIQSFGAVMIKKELLFNYFPFVSLDSDNSMFGPLDYFLWVSILPNTTFYYINIPLFLYRIHDNNYVKNVEIFNNQAILIYRKLINDHPTDIYIRNICSFFIEYLAMMSAFSKHDITSSLKHRKGSFVYNKTIYFWQRLLMFFILVLPSTVSKYIISLYKKI